MPNKKLSPEEESVIVYKGTERPYSGKYYDHKKEGFYLCKRCGAALYHSNSKFDSRSGWPSFDNEIPNAVDRVQDADGMRVEIICRNCGAHLGHVFKGEGFTPKNLRHCVNSISLEFLPIEQTDKAIFASGCFWGTEYMFQKAKGVLMTTVGYTGGHSENPTYKQVCLGVTGHAEAIEVIYNPAQTTYEELVKLFFETHDPTQRNRQGPDIGEQYRSAIFYFNDEQKNIAEKLIKTLEDKGYNIATQINPAQTFYQAEDYHQDYYIKKGSTPYCHHYVPRF